MKHRLTAILPLALVASSASAATWGNFRWGVSAPQYLWGYIATAVPTNNLWMLASTAAIITLLALRRLKSRSTRRN